MVPLSEIFHFALLIFKNDSFIYISNFHQTQQFKKP